MASSILVVGEVGEGGLAPITKEMLGAARRLSADGSVGCALIGSGVEAHAQSAIAHGADEVFVVDDAALAEYNADTYLQAMLKVAEQASAPVILFGQTNLGRDLAPRLAFRLETGVIMDTIELAMEGGRLHGTRPCYGGNARAVHVVNADPQVATVRAKSQEPAIEDSSRQGQVTNVDAAIDQSAIRVKVTSRSGVSAEGVRLEDADVVVSGGRGLGGPENFDVIEELATVLGAAVGASRAVCDLEWRPVSDQVGLTGKVVSPTLYIAVAISGASQHMAGCSGSKNIVAINKDADANIFKASRFGIAEDYATIMKPLIEAVKQEKGA
ncbi:MAG: electron transfer flavoprotein subunit alpha/FixB family protein [Chloroflexi bacterium]|nr:electron transfer flavoprotein subunit alpha/FixB family protein [Chloroflexota bacterium]